MSARVRTATGIIALALTYFVFGKLGLSVAFLNKSASAVWPPTGIALAALLLWGGRLWPGVFLGAFLVNITTQGSLLTSVGIATGNTLEAVLGWALVRRFASGTDVFERVSDILSYILLAAALSTAVSATCGVTTLCLGGFEVWPKYGPTWLTWWLGDLVSDLLVAPLLVLWSTRDPPSLKRQRVLEGAALLVATAATGLIVFGQRTYSFAYIALLPCLWAVFRFGQRAAITCVCIISCFALWATLHGRGQFASANVNESLLLLQGFIGTLSVVALVIGSVTRRRTAAEQRLYVQHSVSRVLAESPRLYQATPKILQTLCEKTGWDVAAIWYIQPGAREMTCGEMWHAPKVDVSEFEARSHEFHFEAGTGLPGRVWSTNRAMWIPDLSKDANFPRAPAALKAGLKTGMAFPLRLGDRSLGVLECFSQKVRGLDDDFLQMMETIGDQIGQFIERRRAEEALRISEETHRMVSETAADGIITIDEASTIISVNPAAERIFGYKSAELIGKPLTMLMPERMREIHRAGIERYLRTGERNIPWKGVELPGLRQDGSEVPLEISFGIALRNGKRVFSGVVRDITERKQAEEKLRQSEARLVQANAELEKHARGLEQIVAARTAELRETVAELESFSYSIAHDMRGPLRAMIAFSQAVVEDYGGKLDAQGIDFLDRIHKSALRLDALIRDVLNYSRVAKAEIDLKPIDLGRLIKDIIEQYPDLKPPAAQVTIHEPLPRVLGHEAYLTQCVSNLLGNAVKFVRPDVQPRIDIRAQEEGELVKLWIEDNGIGIEAAHFERIFQIFGRVYSDKKYEGTGIGLAIAKKAVERMGGQIGIESELGKGSRFWIRLKRPA